MKLTDIASSQQPYIHFDSNAQLQEENEWNPNPGHFYNTHDNFTLSQYAGNEHTRNNYPRKLLDLEFSEDLLPIMEKGLRRSHDHVPSVFFLNI